MMMMYYFSTNFECKQIIFHEYRRAWIVLTRRAYGGGGFPSVGTVSRKKDEEKNRIDACPNCNVTATAIMQYSPHKHSHHRRWPLYRFRELPHNIIIQHYNWLYVKRKRAPRVLFSNVRRNFQTQTQWNFSPYDRTKIDRSLLARLYNVNYNIDKKRVLFSWLTYLYGYITEVVFLPHHTTYGGIFDGGHKGARRSAGNSFCRPTGQSRTDRRRDNNIETDRACNVCVCVCARPRIICGPSPSTAAATQNGGGGGEEILIRWL